MAFVTIKPNVTEKDLKEFSTARGLCCRKTTRKGVYSVCKIKTPIKKITQENAEARAMAMANYYLQSCEVSVAIAKFEIKKRQSKMPIKEFLYKTFLYDLLHGNDFAAWLVNFSLYISYSGKMVAFGDKIPYLDFVPKY